MKEPGGKRDGRVSQGSYRPGTYLRCGVCGRLLKIEWATRSIVCACGSRINPAPPGEK